MDLRRVLQVHTRWILRSTPRAQVESDGEVQEGFSTVAGPQGGQCTARLAGGFVHCSRGDAVWCRGPLGHGHVWALQRRAVATGPAVAARGAQPRHLQPGLPPAGPEGARRASESPEDIRCVSTSCRVSRWNTCWTARHSSVLPSPEHSTRHAATDASGACAGAEWEAAATKTASPVVAAVSMTRLPAG